MENKSKKNNASNFQGNCLQFKSKINLNYATVTDIMQLPNMDEQTANDIYEFAQDTIITDSYDLLDLQSIDTYILNSWNQKIDDMRIDLNSADVTKLQKVKDIGKKLANKIEERKKQFGAFTSINQLKTIEGIDRFIFDKLKSRIVIS